MSRDNWFTQAITICWKATTLSIFFALLSKINQYSSMLYKSAFRIFDSEGTLNKGRVRGQSGSLGNTLNQAKSFIFTAVIFILIIP